VLEFSHGLGRVQPVGDLGTQSDVRIDVESRNSTRELDGGNPIPEAIVV
jgi:hypothetical protein